VAAGAAALLLSGILIANLLNSVFAQQTPQIGMMKAVGARSGHIGRLYLLMTLVVAATATLLGVGPAVVMGRALAITVLGFLGVLPTSLNAPAWIYAVISMVGLCVPLMMAIGPLVRASRTTYVRPSIIAAPSGLPARY
jgi:putative ABC transport system permease protein